MCVDAPVDASGICSRLLACGQVLTCVRPRVAADHMPRALMEVCGSGPLRLPARYGAIRPTGFPDPVSMTVCP